MSNKLQLHVENNRQRFLDELCELLRIPSISTLPDHSDDVQRAAEFVAASLRTVGLQTVEIIPTERHPLIYGEWLEAPGKPTVLFYGHYDVQPVDPLDLWESPPFEPRVEGGNLYARGACDDKGQMYAHIKALETLRDVHGTFPVNVKFLIEGEEEVGGESIAAYIPANREKLSADVALVSDTAMYAPNMPTLCTGLRGMVYMEWEAHGPSHDLHSGLYGGAAPNAVYGLVELLAKCKDAGGVIRIPGVYDDVAEPSSGERESWRQLPFDEADYLSSEVGSTALAGEAGYSVFEQTWARPTFEVHGVAGGFTGPGGKTVIPATATAKVSMRLVPHQDPAKVLALVREFVEAETPLGIEVEVRGLYSAPATLVDPDHPAVETAARALSDVFGKPTVYIRSGGSVPVVGDITRHLGTPAVLMGFGLPDDRLHSPNEKFALENYYKGITAVAHFLDLLGQSGLLARS